MAVLKSNILFSRFAEPTGVYVCTVCHRVDTEPMTCSGHFVDCTVVILEGHTHFQIGTTVVPPLTKAYECAVCEEILP